MNNTSIDGNPIVFQFNTLRNISSKLDILRGRKTIIGYVPIIELKKLVNNSNDKKVDKSANVRDYTDKYKGKEVSTRSGVPQKIWDTLENEPEKFHILNGGITYLCDRSQTNPKKEIEVSFIKPSIANGGHTVDVILKFLTTNPNSEALVKVEVVYIDANKPENNDLEIDISIARNSQTAVQERSIMGRQGIFDDLNYYMENSLALSETSADKIPPERVLQCTFLLCPNEAWERWDNKTPSRPTFYSATRKHLSTYRKIHETRLDKTKEQWNFINKISTEAYNLWLDFQHTDLFNDLHKGKIKENCYTDLNNGKKRIKWGWVAPIISALSFYVNPKDGSFKKPNKAVMKGIIASIWRNGYEFEKNLQTLAKTPNAYRQPLKDLKDESDLIEDSKQIFKN